MLKGLALAAAWLAMTAQAPAAQGDEADLLRSMRGFAGVTVGGPAVPADKLLTFGRNAKGEIVVTELSVLARGGDWPPPAAGALAVMRSRAAGKAGRKAPKPADFEFVRANGVPAFIVGEWSKPPVIWQVAMVDGQVRWREVGADASAGPWRSPAAEGKPR